MTSNELGVAARTRSLPLAVLFRSHPTAPRYQRAQARCGGQGCPRPRQGGRTLTLDTEDAAERGLGGPVAAHAVDAAAGGRRAGADVEASVRRRVGVVLRDGAGEELAEVVGAAADVAADHVRVVLFEPDGVDGVAREYQIAEARREALYLRLYPLGHVHARAVRDVAVGPARLLARGRARLVEQTLLRDEDEGALGVYAAPDGGLGPGDIFDGRAEVDGRRAPARLGPPRDRPAERPVELEDAGAVPEL